MTIHREHPFLDPESDRDPARRLRGRLGGAVTLWTAGHGTTRAGLTVSSAMVALGDPSRLLALVDPDSDLYAALEGAGRAVVHPLRWRHRDLADAFAGVAPAPGGAFRSASFDESRWGPRLDPPGTWAGVRLEEAAPLGWSVLVTTVIEETVITDDGDDPLLHRRGRYLRLE